MWFRVFFTGSACCPVLWRERIESGRPFYPAGRPARSSMRCGMCEIECLGHISPLRLPLFVFVFEVEIDFDHFSLFTCHFHFLGLLFGCCGLWHGGWCSRDYGSWHLSHNKWIGRRRSCQLCRCLLSIDHLKEIRIWEGIANVRIDRLWQSSTI